MFSFLSNQKERRNADQESGFGEEIRELVNAQGFDKVVFPRESLPTIDDSQYPRHGIQNDRDDDQHLNPDRLHIFFNPTTCFSLVLSVAGKTQTASDGSANFRKPISKPASCLSGRSR